MNYFEDMTKSEAWFRSQGSASYRTLSRFTIKMSDFYIELGTKEGKREGRKKEPKKREKEERTQNKEPQKTR